MPGVLLCCSQLYSLETGSLTELDLSCHPTRLSNSPVFACPTLESLDYMCVWLPTVFYVGPRVSN